MAEFDIYPIGQQDFKKLREDQALYIDKTDYIEKIARSKGNYFFLARPRRFGKSLFLSTLRYFFEGKRELFRGLYIDSTDWDWEPYPVLRIDLNPNRYDEPGLFDSFMDNILTKYEREYEVTEKALSISDRFQNLLAAAHKITGRRVVILVDEYDKPLVGNLNKDDLFEHYRAALASVYANFKSSSEHIRLVFLTGVSRFSKLSLFSDLNNINDISFDEEYSDICGITEKELHANFREGIESIAENKKITPEETYSLLKSYYDGYRFSPNGSDIYNPWSLLCAMSKKTVTGYWSATGKPTLIAEALKNLDADLQEILNSSVPMRMLVGLDLRSANPVALLYQTGYLTIKEYDFETETVTLGVPNREVKESLLEDLLPYYVSARRYTPDMMVSNIIKDIRRGEPE